MIRKSYSTVLLFLITEKNLNLKQFFFMIYNHLLNQDSKLAYLDLKGFTAFDEVSFLEELLTSCCELQKITLTFKTLNPKIVKALAQNGQSLQVRTD